MVVHVTAVLLCQGRGADPSSYRPNRDQSQWWSRRDALVRCVTAFLFGPSPQLQQQHEQNGNGNIKEATTTTTRELILVHDEDWATMKISYDESSSSSTPIIVPTEQNILSLFKAAAKALRKLPRSKATSDGVVVHQQGITCRLRAAPLNQNNATLGTLVTSTITTSSSSMAMAPKRDILQALQSQCTLDFLRQHGLNCSTEVCLKKRNKNQLLQIWKTWQQQEQQKDTAATPNQIPAHKATNNAQAIVESIFWNILQEDDSQQQPSLLSKSQQRRKRKVAAILHESCESELPCFGMEPFHDNDGDNNEQDEFHIYLFMGAVRDMHTWEEEALQSVWSRCRHVVVGGGDKGTSPPPLLRIRLGPVPEFSSKILTVLAFHHATGMLEVALRRMIKALQQDTDATTNTNEAQGTASQKSAHPPVSSSPSSTLSKQKRKRESFEQQEAGHAADSAFVSSDSSSNSNNTITNNWLHIICFLPISFDEFSTALEDRNRVLWGLVRVTVCTLWRSRLASSSSSSSNLATRSVALNNSLTLVLLASSRGDDNDDCNSSSSHPPLVVSVSAEDFVSSLAQQHQAAPSENQILQIWKDLLQRKLREQQDQKQQSQQQQRKPKHHSKQIHPAWASQLISSLLTLPSSTSASSSSQVSRGTTVALAISEPPGNDHQNNRDSISKRFYSALPVLAQKQKRQHRPIANHHLMVLLPISPIISETASHLSVLSRACQLQEIPVLHDKLIPDEEAGVKTCQDCEAATVTLLQHLAYQQRLFV